MLRILLATVIGAVLLFAWGMASWTRLGLHDNAVRMIPDETAVAAYLQQQGLRTGTYTFPGMPKPGDLQAAGIDPVKAQEDFIKRHEQGPIFTIFFSSEGETPMSPRTLSRAWAINLVSVFIAVLLLRPAARGGLNYVQRVGFVMLMGIFAAILGHGSLFVWMNFPASWTVPMIVDMAIGWTLVGLVLAAMIKAPAVASAIPPAAGA